MKKKQIDLKLLEGMIVSGQTYLLLCEAHSHSDAGPIEDLFTIRTVEDVVTAIEGLDRLISERFEYRELLEVRSRDDDRSVLRVWCHDKKRKKNRPLYLFLHRIPGVAEMMNQAKERIDAGALEDRALPSGHEGQEDIG
jgi:hypothetical protein